MSIEPALIKQVIEELDALASFRPPLFSSILLTRQAYLFLRQHVSQNELELLLKGLKLMQAFYRRSMPFRLLLLLISATLILAAVYPFLPSIFILPLFSAIATTFVFLLLFGNSILLKPYVTQASRLFASQAREARRISHLLITLYGGKIRTLALFFPEYYNVEVLRKCLAFNPFLVIKSLVIVT